MKCDYHDVELPPDYEPEVDANGRPTQALCRLCKDVQLLERARRLGLPAPDMLDLFALHLSREIKPRVH